MPKLLKYPEINGCPCKQSIYKFSALRSPKIIVVVQITGVSEISVFESTCYEENAIRSTKVALTIHVTFAYETLGYKVQGKGFVNTKTCVHLQAQN